MDPYSNAQPPATPDGPADILANSDRPVKISNYLSEGWNLFIANPGLPIAYALIFVVLNFIPYLGTLIIYVLSGPLMAGFYLALRKQVTGQSVQFTDYLQGFNNAVPLILVGFLSNVLIGIGMILLILPGIYLAVSYMFAIILVADRNLDFWEAMETSRKFITRQWFVFFVLALVLFAINAVGVLLFGIGLLVTIPFATAVVFAAYRDLIGLKPAAV